jgi:hypothetical protein
MVVHSTTRNVLAVLKQGVWVGSWFGRNGRLDGEFARLKTNFD